MDQKPRIINANLPFFFVLLILLAGCTNSPAGNIPTPTASVSPTANITSPANTPTFAPTATVSAVSSTPMPTTTAGATPTLVTAGWHVGQNGHIVQMAYGSGASYPQYGALDVNSGYFRLNYGPGSGWGTSIILLPAFWSKGSCGTGGYCQGAPVVPAWRLEGANLALSITSTIGGLHISSTVRLSPPTKNSITAQISTTAQGNVSLDSRPGETYKPVMLSSMHISSTQWDAQFAYAGGRTIAFPASGWIAQPPVNAQNFGLQGGTSSWKTNAPTVQITLDRSLQVTGWVTSDNNPNDDNVGFWSATDTVLPSWSYTVVASNPYSTAP